MSDHTDDDGSPCGYRDGAADRQPLALALQVEPAIVVGDGVLLLDPGDACPG